MRYDKVLYFRKEGAKTYDPETGNSKRADPVDEMRMASVVSTDIRTQNLIYGGIKQGSITLHLLVPYTKPFDYIVYQGKKYRVDNAVTLRTKQAFVASEVQ